MKTLLICAFLTVIVLMFFYVWGKSFLTIIGAPTYTSDCLMFGFIVIHIVFQVFYLPFLLARGSFYTLAIIWVIVAFAITTYMVFYLNKEKILSISIEESRTYYIVLIVAIIVVGILCIFIGGHPRNHGIDTIQYIYQMDKMVYRGTMWNEGNELQIHQGLNSYYALFAILSWLTGIKSVYLGHFTMRFLGVIMCSIMSFRFGRIAFGKKSDIYPLAVAIFVPIAMLAWDSMYGLGMFFFARTNESKAFCQILLFPLAVSVFWEMFLEGCNRRLLWIEAGVIGVSAVPVAVSSMSIYPVIVVTAAVGLITYDGFKGWVKTALYAGVCMAPNFLYMFFYVLYQRQILRF